MFNCEFRIVHKKSNLKVASWVDVALILHWFFSFLSVLNVGEIACAAPIVIAIWLVVKNGSKLFFKDSLLIGIMLALVFFVRFQTVIFSAGFGLALLLPRVPFKQLIIIVLGFLVTAFITLGISDIYV